MSHTILIVEDDKDLVFLLKDTLEKQGYVVATAPDGMQGLRISKDAHFDLMIVDLTMPHMNGWQFTMKVRQDVRYKKIPIIVLSGLLERDADPEGFESASAYVAKPFDIFKLLDKIKDLLKSS